MLLFFIYEHEIIIFQKCDYYHWPLQTGHVTRCPPLVLPRRWRHIEAVISQVRIIKTWWRNWSRDARYTSVMTVTRSKGHATSHNSVTDMA